MTTIILEKLIDEEKEFNEIKRASIEDELILEDESLLICKATYDKNKTA